MPAPQEPSVQVSDVRALRASRIRSATGCSACSAWKLRLTPEQAQRLADELNAVMTRWAADHPASEPAEGSELVSVLLDVVPLEEWPT